MFFFFSRLSYISVSFAQAPGGNEAMVKGRKGGGPDHRSNGGASRYNSHCKFGISAQHG